MVGSQPRGFGTLAVHAGLERDQVHGAVVATICTSTTFAQTAPGVPIGSHEYARSSNPTRKVLERGLAALENGKHAFAFASGLAAITTVCHTLKTGDHVVVMEDVYGGTMRYLTKVLCNFDVAVDCVDCTNIEALKAAIKPNTKMFWLESPTNPTLRLLDLAALVEIGKAHGITVVVDNTFMSPYFQRPLALGVTVVVHSMTKYINGHSDVVMGTAITNDDAIAARLKFLQNSLGGVPSPMDCYQVLRGLKTLHLRMERHATNAMAVAKFLESHPKVEAVIYPGLPSHPQYSLAKKQMTGFGGMISFRVKGGNAEASAFLQALKIFTLAESLGAVESLAELPCVMTHAGLDSATRAHLGITENLIRLSIGVEDEQDLLQDLGQALDAAVGRDAM